MTEDVRFAGVETLAAASVPAGFGSDGLPLSVQLVGRGHDETTMLAAAARLEQQRPRAEHRPPGP